MVGEERGRGDDERSGTAPGDSCSSSSVDAILLAIKQALTKAITVSAGFCNLTSLAPVNVSLDAGIEAIYVENPGTQIVDVFLSTVSGGNPHFSVGPSAWKSVPCSGDVASVTVVPRVVGTGVARVWVTNQVCSYASGAITGGA